jgi:hypothetical protein
MSEKTLADLEAERDRINAAIADYPTEKTSAVFVPQPGLALHRRKFNGLSAAEKMAHIRAGGTVFE